MAVRLEDLLGSKHLDDGGKSRLRRIASDWIPFAKGAKKQDLEELTKAKLTLETFAACIAESEVPEMAVVRSLIEAALREVAKGFARLDSGG